VLTARIAELAADFTDAVENGRIANHLPTP
jgi:hypothetical protein